MLSKLSEKFKRYSVIINFLQYGFVGIIGTIIHTSVLVLLVDYLKITPVISTVVGFIFSLVVSYKLNSKWTFKGTNRGIHSFVRYAMTCSIGLIINVIIMFITVNILEYSYLVGQCFSIITVPIFNFTLSRYWVFNKSSTSDT